MPNLPQDLWQFRLDQPSYPGQGWPRRKCAASLALPYKMPGDSPDAATANTPLPTCVCVCTGVGDTGPSREQIRWPSQDPIAAASGLGPGLPRSPSGNRPPAPVPIHLPPFIPGQRHNYQQVARTLKTSSGSLSWELTTRTEFTGRKLPKA